MATKRRGKAGGAPRAEWRRLDEAKVRNKGGAPGHAIGRRLYAPPGRVWPRIILAIWPGDTLGTVRFDVSRKERAAEWWDSPADLPRELAGEFAEMLLEWAAGRKPGLTPSGEKG